ncbi:MAG: hypothetical protein A2W01_05015 [Candidatus Solincola sediminis]|uniref:Divergent polysaccharide deacetylase family protein n=1 Tax=Candidatus Solincola sediminis TaxID=1797199 RepID=A0A1F2WFB4_9ACTN|nr:MAG: hypothetical protein A2Y75_09470 [Candidatus Solincola sediminis]OFW57783.1 MAG: hypothetical protein A2W01_05015 [Candidatus Solincola sediminis]
MDDYLKVDAITDIQKRLRREQMLKRRKKACVVLGLAFLLAGVFLFSSIGPLGFVFFPKSTAILQEQPDVPDENQAVVTAKAGLLEKDSNPAAPTIAIVVDDTGSAPANLDKWLEVDAPLTFATMPFTQATHELAETLYEAGYRIMMHIPTENDSPNSFSATGQLTVGMSREIVFATLDDDLAQIPHVTGINNHQGGKGCNDLSLMAFECEWAKGRGLFVVDSDSSTASKVSKAANGLGMPRRLNQLFIDHQNEPDYIRSIMRRLADIARRNGTAIGICHFHRPNTPTIVGEMVGVLKAEGIHFAFVEDISN